LFEPVKAIPELRNLAYNMRSEKLEEWPYTSGGRNMTEATTDTIPTIGDVIRAWRKYRELRPSQLADMAQVRRPYLSELEHNKTANPRPEHLEKLATVLRVPVIDLLGRVMPPDTATKEASDLKQQTSQTMRNTHKVAQRRRGVRFGAGIPIEPTTSADVLRDVLHRTEEIRRQADETHKIVEELLRDIKE